MTEHLFHLTARWPGERNAVGDINAGNLQTNVSIPKEMDGPGIGTNPDEMLLGAAATCYMITLAALLERANIQTNTQTLQSVGTVDVTNGVFTYKKIVHKPTIVLMPNATPAQIERANRFAIKAEETCMISKALRGNVQLEVEATIQVAPVI
ncbi:OsmC family protein [Kurthia senegalensis]|uniref:OsmC family protein n=1 Tax=Kurthia senegalensis TaxID=1033740 RepID=UPI000288E84D|nr:OsmC family protein [Kurthia senegalensis]